MTEMINKKDYERLAEFRYRVRLFLRFSEQEAKKVGITPQQHQLLLIIKGFPDRDYVTPKEIAERLQITHHACVGLIDRCERQDLIFRRPNPEDKRSVFVELTEYGMNILAELSMAHFNEVKKMSQLIRSFNNPDNE